MEELAQFVSSLQFSSLISPVIISVETLKLHTNAHAVVCFFVWDANMAGMAIVFFQYAYFLFLGRVSVMSAYM